MVVMGDTEMVKLIVSVPRELKERLDAVAKEEDRPLASVVRRMLGKAVEGGPFVVFGNPDTRSASPVVQVKGKPPATTAGHPVSALTDNVVVPVGGQDAAAGKGVEDRREEAAPTIPDLIASLESSLSEAKAARPRPVDHVVIGGADCTHPQRFVLGRKCEATGCGKVIG